MQKWFFGCILCAVMTVPLAWSLDSEASGSELPAGVPSDAPFPSDVKLKVTTASMSGAEQVVISFTFRGDADALYGDFKEYLLDNGYSIAMEDNQRLTARGEGVQSCIVDVQEMGSVNLATVTFVVPPDAGE